ncbi:tRNA(Ile)-lysidine synthase [Psychromicrobium silvestre]|uniref:tRNA(Ile)-lysidine synthase n=1 Tax=Psychromicrobium silvestre TaxID=1645614 RepID=A0A7Y9LUW5_9MICC|nr:tRNA lysidine(34) synthetase TilS [Psychromicrobium silvestre]NYE96053.1 tRNA(Ile)-lysidine synthase [Psychromicrobium silvestre]
MSDGVPDPRFGASPRRHRLNPTIGKARNLLQVALEKVQPGGLLLVACSGGPDSLALASVAAFFARRGSWRVGAVVVDHGLQEGSAEVAQRTADLLKGLGLAPVEVRTVQVGSGSGPEAAARQARYAALDAAAEKYQAAAVLLGHTLDDQAEQVLLGLARGSGTRSLGGMPASRLGAGGSLYLRPFLSLRRAETVTICQREGLEPWHDPSNADPGFTRSRVRHRVLPMLEQELGPGVAESLFRSASILSQDADYLDQLAREAYRELSEVSSDGAELFLSESGLAQLHPAVRQRVLALAVVALGGAGPSFERLQAAEALLRRRGSAGPVQLSGKVSVYRQSRSERALDSKLDSKRDSKQPGGCGKLVMRTNPSNQ